MIKINKISIIIITIISSGIFMDQSRASTVEILYPRIPLSLSQIDPTSITSVSSFQNLLESNSTVVSSHPERVLLSPISVRLLRNPISITSISSFHRFSERESPFSIVGIEARGDNSEEAAEYFDDPNQWGGWYYGITPSPLPEEEQLLSSPVRLKRCRSLPCESILVNNCENVLNKNIDSSQARPRSLSYSQTHYDLAGILFTPSSVK